MIMKNFNAKFIVSCQALENEPMYGKTTVLKMARSAMQGGAQGIRTSQVSNINLILKENFKVPVIGIIKKNYPDSEVFITPTLTELKKLIKTKVDIIALDATLRERPKQDLKFLVEYFKKNKAKNQKLMADCATLEEMQNAISLGFDIISSTLRGYTQETKNKSNTEKGFTFLKKAIKLAHDSNKIFIAEGGFNTPELARKALLLNSDAVVVGSAITRPQFITKQFKDIIFKDA
ncbi:N-acetylmannosamine-6-phosphate 2-epimerase [Mycoplasmopsis synoviae]|nr:N-acetylmannosamine-6-phosphate epimerase [Mycoplasmopsis synoviae]ACN42886.1 N-acetylmannosamine-6-phosphate epimerase [Mycoplasmopsis synoviae]ACN42892.1 N-acetylmannosamine-6-phosphate epimerase [Mycoplasmopsis synoviae]UBX97221.1 N-acetylmannosamine-6-phosphate 2-epimerase [Mycoplasmopsis synoviae]UBX97913.1 N-acetylmannosamine-6-phosphate 2-epimerase [Mycoplasmopsis synoviae]